METKVVTKSAFPLAGAWEAFRAHYEAFRAAEEEAPRAITPLALAYEGVWTIAGALELLLFMRFVFNLFGVGYYSFTMPVFAITSIAVAPFAAAYGLFESSVRVPFFDIAAVIAAGALPLLAWGIIKFNPTHFYAREQ